MEHDKAIELAKAISARARTLDPERADQLDAKIKEAEATGNGATMLLEQIELLAQGPKNLAQQLNIKVGIRMKLEKFEGDYHPGKKPFETIVSEDQIRL